MDPESQTLTYTVEQVAALLGMSKQTVYRALKESKIRSIRLRGKWLIPVQAVEELLSSGNQPQRRVE